MVVGGWLAAMYWFSLPGNWKLRFQTKMVWLDARASNGGIFGLVIEGFFFFCNDGERGKVKRAAFYPRYITIIGCVYLVSWSSFCSRGTTSIGDIWVPWMDWWRISYLANMTLYTLKQVRWYNLSSKNKLSYSESVTNTLNNHCKTRRKMNVKFQWL